MEAQLEENGAREHEKDLCRGHDYVHDSAESDSSTNDTPYRMHSIEEKDPDLANVRPQPWDHIRVVVEGADDMTLEEKRAYAEYAYRKEGSAVEWIKVKVDGGDVDIEYHIAQPKFSRIARITGYLTGSVDRWNDAKRHELADRVHHTPPGMSHDQTVRCTCESCTGDKA